MRRPSAVATSISEIPRRGYRRRLLRRVKPNDFKESYIARALARYSEATYLEIGVREGESFRLARAARKLGIDPVARPQLERLQPGEEFYAMTSNEFFEGPAGEVLAPASVHVALIDGLHEFRQVARDLLELEPYMRPDGLIFLDDINPASRAVAEDVPQQEIDVRGSGAVWNGDVWKIAALLRDARADLTLHTVDADQGVGVVSGFGATVRRDDLEAAIERCKALDYTELESSRGSLLHLIAPADFADTLRALVPR